MLQPFASDLYLADGPTVSFLGFPYPTRMAVVQLLEPTELTEPTEPTEPTERTDRDLWVWSPIALTNELADAIDAIGTVRYIVSPNKIHHLFLPDWANRWPDARVYAPPGLARRKPDIQFDAELDDDPETPTPWSADIDQVIVRGSFAMEEVVFFHRASKTAIVGDLIQRHPPENMSGWKGLLMRLDDLVGETGSTPREWRASFLDRPSARAARQTILNWQAERLLIAHGDCVTTEAAAIIETALGWI